MTSFNTESLSMKLLDGLYRIVDLCVVIGNRIRVIIKYCTVQSVAYQECDSMTGSNSELWEIIGALNSDIKTWSFRGGERRGNCPGLL